MLTRNFVGRYSDEMARHFRFTAVVRISKFATVCFGRTWDQTPNFRYLLLWSSDGSVSSRLRGISLKNSAVLPGAPPMGLIEADLK